MNIFNANKNLSSLSHNFNGKNHFLVWMGYIYLIIPLLLNIQFVFKSLNFINNTVIIILKVKSLYAHLHFYLSTIAKSKVINIFKAFDINSKITFQKGHNNLEFH